jgi:hypothetical protein
VGRGVRQSAKAASVTAATAAKINVMILLGFLVASIVRVREVSTQSTVQIGNPGPTTSRFKQFGEPCCEIRCASLLGVPQSLGQALGRLNLVFLALHGASPFDGDEIHT